MKNIDSLNKCWSNSMKYFLLTIATICVGECESQIIRSGVLKGKLLSDSTKEYVVIDYSDKEYLQYKIYDLQTNHIVGRGFLNRLKYNNSHLHNDPVLYEKRTYYNYERMGVLADGFTHYEPTIEFRDTVDLVNYDYMHLLHDSVTIRYTKKIIDTTRNKIYSCSNGKYYSMILGNYSLYSEGNLFSTEYVKEIGKDIFFMKDYIPKNDKTGVEQIKIWSPLIGIVSEFNYDIDKDHEIKDGTISIYDSSFRYENKMLYELNNDR